MISYYLQKLIINKQQEVALLKQQRHLSAVKPRISNKSFKASIAQSRTVIAEVKRRSPSKPYIGKIADPVALVEKYAIGGAKAVSVVTDSYGFGGSIEDLKIISAALAQTPITVLRKDFIIDSIQIVEAVQAGADAILLIVKVLDRKTECLLKYAKTMNIEAVIEVMNQKELEYALSLSPDIIAVNNRNLETFEVDRQCALILKSSIPNSIVSIVASGIDSPSIGSKYFSLGYDALLIGEALVKAKDPVKFIKVCQKR